MESETESTCLPTEKSLDLSMYPAWTIVARIAGSLMASSGVRRPEIIQEAVKLAREIVMEARKPETSSESIHAAQKLPEYIKPLLAYTVNGHACETDAMLSIFEPKDRERILALEIGSTFHATSAYVQGSGTSGIVVRRTR